MTRPPESPRHHVVKLEYLSNGDLEAIAKHLFAKPAIAHDVGPKRWKRCRRSGNARETASK
jgi:hypothetical protein